MPAEAPDYQSTVALSDELEFFYRIYVNQHFRVRESEVQHGSQALSSAKSWPDPPQN